MLARLQQIVVFFLSVVTLFWAYWAVSLGRPTWAALGAMLILVGYALFLATEFMLLRGTHASDPTPKATVSQLVRAWISEMLTAPRIFCWQQPFRSTLVPDYLPIGTQRRGVVLVHGFVCNRGFWNRWSARLRERRVPFVAVNLEPVFGSISDYVPIIDKAVQQVIDATGQSPVLVGHSMGGLAIRAWLARPGNAARHHRVITIGSPHRGTWLGRFGTSRNSQEMALGTPWQRSLEASESAEHFQRFTCFYSHCDNIVFPPSTATLPGADNRHVIGSAHVQLLDQPEVFDELIAWLDIPQSTASALGSTQQSAG